MNIHKQSQTPPVPLPQASSKAMMMMNRPRRLSRTSSWNTASERTAKNRKIVNSYLRRMHHHHRGEKKDLVLNESGVCIIQYKKFIIALEVPDDNSGCFVVSSMVFRIDNGDINNRLALMEKAMELNYMQEETRGACLGLQGDEISLCFSAPIATLTREHLVHYMEDFMQTCAEMNAALEALKRKF
jgi:hypothetical protein